MRKRTVALVLVVMSSCAAKIRYIPGTTVPATNVNRQIIQAVEGYRLAVERKDTPALVAMASKSYWEDGGTPTGTDDYGLDGLRDALVNRFQRAESIRYSMRYLNIKLEREAQLALVDVLIDASYSIPTARGSERQDMREQNRLVLERDGDRWVFLSGM